MKLNAMTVRKIASPGIVATHHWARRSRPLLTIAPHSGVGGVAPSPRKLKPAPVAIAAPTSIVARTIILGRMLGKIVRRRIPHDVWPRAVAASTYSDRKSVV